LRCANSDTATVSRRIQLRGSGTVPPFFGFWNPGQFAGLLWLHTPSGLRGRFRWRRRRRSGSCDRLLFSGNGSRRSRHALLALGMNLLVQKGILSQQRLPRVCAIETNGKSCDQEDYGEDPSRAKQEAAPVRTSLQHALAMHWSYRRVCDRKGEIEFIGPGLLRAGGSKGKYFHSPFSRHPQVGQRRCACGFSRNLLNRGSRLA